MNAIYSPTAGVVVFPAEETSVPEVHHLGSQYAWSGVETLHMLSTIRDWQAVDAEDVPSALQKCSSTYWLKRAVASLICLIEGVSEPLTIEVLGHVEEILQTRCSSDDILSRLLIAPLHEPPRASHLAHLALGNGFATVAALLDRLFDLQPLLGRLADRWLDLPAQEFANLTVPRETCWTSLSETSLLPRLLDANSDAAFRTAWNGLVFDEPSPQGRSSIARIGDQLAVALFPYSVRESEDPAKTRVLSEDEDSEQGAFDSTFPNKEAFHRAMKQVDSIVEAVAAGRDRTAKRFLRELVSEQLQTGGRDYVVKSLCNIAQKCADLFRADFEHRCLNEALQHDPHDPWTQIQMGNHLKRTGHFSEAVEMLQKAVSSNHGRIAAASIADVWAEQGKYDRAREVYKKIANWADVVEVRTGLADIFRHEGRFEEAEAEYAMILQEWPDADRAVAGKAEIARARGLLNDAVLLYDQLIYHPGVDVTGKLVYRLAKCDTLKQANRLGEAYPLIEDLVRDSPFCMRARIRRASILGLLGKDVEALSDIRTTSLAPAFGTWVRDYFRGLLLLKLRKYKEAKSILMAQLNSALLSRHDRTILRIGSACASLCNGDIEQAASTLAQVESIRDCFAQYVSYVLQLHVAVAKADAVQIEAISSQLEEPCQYDKCFADVVALLRDNNLVAARTCEVELLLRVAA